MKNINIPTDTRFHSNVQQQAWHWLYEKLAQGITAHENEFIKVSATDVIKRNKNFA